VAVGVGGTGVDVCVGGTVVGGGAVVAVAGTELGMLVTEMGVLDVTHPASTSIVIVNKTNNGNFFVISCLL
jgi:hypothetical protein